MLLLGGVIRKFGNKSLKIRRYRVLDRPKSGPWAFHIMRPGNRSRGNETVSTGAHAERWFWLRNSKF